MTVTEAGASVAFCMNLDALLTTGTSSCISDSSGSSPRFAVSLLVWVWSAWTTENDAASQNQILHRKAKGTGPLAGGIRRELDFRRFIFFDRLTGKRQ